MSEQSKNAHSVKSNYIYNIIYQFLVLLLPLITTPYVTRSLGPDGVGMYGLTYSISQYFVLFGCIGLNLYGQREIAYCQDNTSKRSCVFYELFIVRTVTMTISLFVFFFTACSNNKYGVLFKIESLELVGALLDITWFFQGLEEFKKIVVRNSIVKVVGAICVFVFVNNQDDVPVYALILSSTVLVGNLTLWLYLPKYLQKVNKKELSIRKHIKPVFTLFIPQIATSIYNILDKSMIGLITGSDAEVAYYEQAQKIIKMALALPTAVGTVMLPRVASMFGKGEEQGIKNYINTSMRFVCLMTFPLCGGIIGIAKIFVPLFYGPGFSKVYDNFLVIAPIIIIVGISNVLGVQYLLPTNRQKDYSRSVLVGTFVNFTFNAILIPSLMSIGAAIGSIVAELSVTICQLIIVRKTFPLKEMIKNIYKYFIGAVIMTVGVLLYSYYWGKPTILHLAAEIIIGVLIYGLYLLLIKDSLVTEQVEKFRKKLKKEKY